MDGSKILSASRLAAESGVLPKIGSEALELLRADSPILRRIPVFRMQDAEPKPIAKYGFKNYAPDSAEAALYAAAEGTVLRVRGLSGSKILWHGTMYRIGSHEQGDVYATAWHAAFREEHPDATLQVVMPDGAIRPARSIVENKDIDAALVLTEGTISHLPSLTLGRAKDLNQDDLLGLAGYPASKLRLSAGTYWKHDMYGRLRDPDNMEVFALEVQTEVPSWNGFSGGPYLYRIKDQTRVAGTLTAGNGTLSAGFASEYLRPMIDLAKGDMPPPGKKWSVITYDIPEPGEIPPFTSKELI